MDKCEETAILERSKTRPAEFSGVNKKDRFSKYNVPVIIIESSLVGCSLFLAFLVRQIHFTADGRQFLVGPGEIFRMSLGIAFCYAFICVLRREYRWGLNSPAKETAKRMGQYIVETHVLYLALLFLANDVNFTSTKLAIGMSALTSAVLLFSCRFAYRSVRTREKSPSEHRKITLKKPPYSYELETSSPAGENAETRRNAFPREHSKVGKSINGSLTEDPGENQYRPGRHAPEN
ncbi:MAG: hypothetical protein JSW64_05585 [Candidatus Zixiibacteriota bacterium]|nr:MAG: hypothetical protein JSW64_05585 [candidate division Zixibacteria bacterium]